jgi:UDP-2,4-diacetamido-2,4,6-trideoxy-beta-L-altropyranose hydrolase
MNREMSKKILIRTDANSRVGMGHLIRSTALALMLEKQFEIIFLTFNTSKELRQLFITHQCIVSDLSVNRAEEAVIVSNEAIRLDVSLVVLDGYDFDDSYQKIIKNRGTKILKIDDLISENTHADLLINQSDVVTREDYSTCSGQILLGPDYALLRPEFLEAASRPVRPPKDIKSVFVSFGGADPDGHTHRVVKTLLRYSFIERIFVLISSSISGSESLRAQYDTNDRVILRTNVNSGEVVSLLQHSQLAIIPSSSLMLEAIATGILIITGATANNQMRNLESFQKNRLGSIVRDFHAQDDFELMSCIEEVCGTSMEKRNEYLMNQRRFIDGCSGQRVLQEVNQLLA